MSFRANSRKVKEDHEHFDVFAAVLTEKMTGFSPSLEKEYEL